MRHLNIAFAVCSLLLSQPILAQDNAAKLHGAWKLTSWKTQIVGESTPPVEVWGPNPKGYLIFLPNGRMIAYTSAPGRKPPINDAESAALLRTMNAYTGKYTGRQPKDKFTVKDPITADQVNWGDVNVAFNPEKFGNFVALKR